MPRSRTIPILKDYNPPTSPKTSKSIPILRETNEKSLSKDPQQPQTPPRIPPPGEGQKKPSAIETQPPAPSRGSDGRILAVRTPKPPEVRSGFESEFDSGRRSLEDVSRDASLENLVYSDSSSQDHDSVGETCHDSAHDSAHESHSSVEVVDEPDSTLYPTPDSTLYPTQLSTSVTVSQRGASATFNIPSSAQQRSYCASGQQKPFLFSNIIQSVGPL